MEESLAHELLRAERSHRPIGIIMLDVDHFKRINDTYGHSTGDMILRQLGHFLTEHTRGGDSVCRYGGEEFTLMLPNASIDETLQRAEELRMAMKSFPLLVGEHVLPPISLSIGLAAFPYHGTEREALLRVADAALYQAKVRGRDQVVIGIEGNRPTRSDTSSRE